MLAVVWLQDCTVQQNWLQKLTVARDWHVCTTVNLRGFKTAVLWLHVQVILDYQFPGISVLGFLWTCF